MGDKSSMGAEQDVVGALAHTATRIAAKVSHDRAVVACDNPLNKQGLPSMPAAPCCGANVPDLRSFGGNLRCERISTVSDSFVG
jgi:hypothetical protein